ncbi:MAG TPA: class I SAM-dependent methyltransferase [Bdellovibrionales bacterium]|nr:class I SAM-dependent methyltransferase [Bdellovibrionales bacterium]
MKIDPLKRFSNRVADYVRYRPTYPKEVVSYLKEQCKPLQTVADIGAGTGIFSKLLLEAGLEVFAVEPNNEMREAAREYLGDFDDIHFVDAPAESTDLEDHTVDLVVAAQAFHWFDRPKAKAEFKRILTPKGRVALIWNTRETESPFGKAYEDFIENYSVDYKEVRQHGAVAEEDLKSFFKSYTLKTFPNQQTLEWKSLLGRYLSASYAPKPGSPQYAKAEAKLRELFDAHQAGGKIQMKYDTEVYLGTL